MLKKVFVILSASLVIANAVPVTNRVPGFNLASALSGTNNITNTIPYVGSDLQWHQTNSSFIQSPFVGNVEASNYNLVNVQTLQSSNLYSSNGYFSFITTSNSLNLSNYYSLSNYFGSVVITNYLCSTGGISTYNGNQSTATQVFTNGIWSPGNWNFTNVNNYNIQVFITGGTINYVQLNGSLVFSNSISTGSSTLILQPNNWATINYNVPPNPPALRWYPF